MTLPTLATRSARARARVLGQRGMALPVALVSLVVVSCLVVGLVVVAAIEPTIAGNQLAVAQARALAEAGVDRALWALSNPGDRDGIPVDFTTPPAPYDGGRAIGVAAGGHAMGGFQVTVGRGTRPYERTITAVGWAPDAGLGARRAVQKIVVTAINPRLIVQDPPAAVSVRGALEAAGSIQVDARADQTCGAKAGTVTESATSLRDAGVDIRGGTADAEVRNRVVSAAGGAIPGEADAVTDVPAAALDAFMPNAADLAALRAVAKARGTYLRGAVSFGAGRRLPDGLVFVDSTSGRSGTGDAADAAAVEVGTGAAADPSGIWSGWLIVNGSLAVTGDVRLRGFVYAQTGLRYEASGTAALSGALVARQSPDGGAARVDALPSGSLRIAYDCRDARTGNGTIPGRFIVKAGSYREASGS